MSPPQRDRRLDILRGIAIFAIAMNHVATESPHMLGVRSYRFGHLFSFDFADVFIMVSGIVSGLYYNGLYRAKGVLACAAATFRRAATVWRAHILCVLTGLAALLLLGTLQDPVGYLLGGILLYDPAPLINILPIYIFLLVILSPMLVLLKRSLAAYLLLSGGVWFGLWAMQFMQDRNLAPWPRADLTSAYFMHPLSAQFLFFLGVLIGTRK